VRRDVHKMRAFVRFRPVQDGRGEEPLHVAWFEPEHHIVAAIAPFFVRRFTQMRWAVLTPECSLYWDYAGPRAGQAGQAPGALQIGPGARKEDAPPPDAGEQLWLTYYQSIFNPARLKLKAMQKEMPRRYWKNLPEARQIPALIAGAQQREAAMIATGTDLFAQQAAPASLDEIGAGIAQCRRCAIGCNGTRAVMGEGPQDSALMIVGEQPGDSEELAGRPFVGPAGQLLRAHLADAGIAAERSYVTNAVKHFKFTFRGKRRLHQNPTAKEIDLCRWWIEGERALVKPKLVLALGASAARSLLGKTVSVQKERGKAMPLEDGSELWLTTHPSYLLRLDDAARAAEEDRLAADLRRVAGRLAELA
jgi:DNA polymerase